MSLAQKLFRFDRGKKYFASIGEENFLHVLAIREPDSLEAATLFHVFLCVILKASENFMSNNLIIVVVENRLPKKILATWKTAKLNKLCLTNFLSR